MKTAKILKKSVLTPGNNWITLLNSANLIKKNAVTPVNFHLYHYASNNPVRYTDPDGRDHGMPPDKEREMKQRDVMVNGKTTARTGLPTEIGYVVQIYNTNDTYRTRPLLVQDPEGESADACIYFSCVNSFMLKGYKPISYCSFLSFYVNEQKEKSTKYVDVIKAVFGLNVTWNEIPSGLSEKELKTLIENKPTVLVFDQKEFWYSSSLKGVHGIAYYNEEMFEPYCGRKSTDFSKIRGQNPNNETKITDYEKGFYFEINEE